MERCSKKLILKELFGGESVYRILLNCALDKEMLRFSGPCVDFAGEKASYARHMQFSDGLLVSNLALGPNIDFICDLNFSLPLASESLAGALLFNCLYILENQAGTITEIYRTLRDGGRLVIASPFISQVMVEPKDYMRLTSFGLDRLLRTAGFCNVRIIPFGDRFSAASYLIQPLLRFRTLKIIAILLAVALDRLVPAALKTKYPAPLGYLCVGTK